MIFINVNMITVELSIWCIIHSVRNVIYVVQATDRLYHHLLPLYLTKGTLVCDFSHYND